MTLNVFSGRAAASRAALLLCVLPVLSSAPLSAQEPQPADTTRTDTARVYELEGLSVRVPRPITTTGGASAVEVRLDSIAVRPAPTLEQVLRQMPLIVIRSNSRGEAQPALRGAEDRQVAVLVDGIPLTLGWDHRTDLSVIPLTAAREVTLIRGLSSVLHGPNVLGGVIEIDVARGAERQAPPEPLTLSAAVDHVGGRQVGITGGTLREEGAGQWVVRGGVGYRDRPGFPLPDLELPPEPPGASFPREALLAEDDLRLNSDFWQVDAFAAARFLSESRRWLSLTAAGYTDERGVPPELHEAGPRLWRYPDQSRLLAALSGGTGQQPTPLGEGDLEFSLGLDFGSTEIDEYSTPAYDEVVGGETSDDRTATLRLLGDHSLGASGELRGALTYADVSHDEVLVPGGPGSYRQRLWSAGAETEWRFDGPGRALGTTRVNLGAAIDGADTPESGDKPPLGRLWDWGARVGATSLLGETGSVLLHGGVSRRVRFPALRELYSGALGKFEPNPALRPEVMLGAEAGFTWRREAVELQVVGFHQRLEDAIVRTAVSTPEGRKFKRVNRDEIRSTGIELLGMVGAGRLTATGDLTLQRVRLIDPEAGAERAEYEPTAVGKLGADLALTRRLSATAAAVYTSEQFCVAPDGGQNEIDASATLDLGLRRLFRWTAGFLGNADALVMVENVTDTAIYDQCGLPQPGRTARLQVRVW